MDDKFRRRAAGAAVLLVATFVIVSILPTPEQAAQQPGVDVVTIPLHEVAGGEPPPPSAANMPPTLAAPPPATPAPAHEGEGTDAQEADIAGDDDGSGEAEARKPVQLALEPSLKEQEAAPAAPPPKAAEGKPAEAGAAKPAPKPADKPAAKTAQKTAEKAPTAGKPVEKAVAPASAKPADKPATAARASDKPETGAWSVQVGGFSDIARARAVQDKLKALGQSSFISPLDTARGTLYRVRAGPYATREAAQAAQGRLKGGGYPEARVVAP
ncbi:SPOR domain-containing protein [Solimonas soli]|uniref:SPOR domain-containing protein n=1 Tax=Solimonas soli TaxID=413479 RepID=UPI00146FA012|nr:SPOR domain-containing protein [Solimonas soli]